LPTDWFSGAKRKEQLDEHIARTGRAAFGELEVSASEKRRRVQEHFSSVAARYDLLNTLLSGGLHYLWKRRAVGRLGLRPGEEVLDLCAGTGDLAWLAAKRVGPQGRVVACDMSRPMLRAGERSYFEARQQARCDLVQGDAEGLPLTSGRFDAAMIGFGIRNLTYLRRGAQEMHRILRPGGRLLCLEFSRPRNLLFRWLYDAYSYSVMPAVGKLVAGSGTPYVRLAQTIRMFPLPEELSRIFRESGFDEVRFELLLNGLAAIHVAHKR
jgi:demethylmenaquinone methyltransferase/2-methoxy-6-polyprenyl-1,4-benzoquinol methylase